MYLKGAAVSSAFRNVPSFLDSEAAALPRGSVISQGPFGDSRGRLQDYACELRDFQEPGTYAVGFRFDTGAGTQYGWARIKWGGCPANTFILRDYAWGDPGDQVRVGETQLSEDDSLLIPRHGKRNTRAAAELPAKSDFPVAPVEGSLGLLALGAVGSQAWRKSRREE